MKMPKTPREGLRLYLRVGQEVLIDGRITVRLIQAKGSSARLQIVADRSIPIEGPKEPGGSPAPR